MHLILRGRKLNRQVERRGAARAATRNFADRVVCRMDGGDQFGPEVDSPRDSCEQLDTLGAQAKIVALPRENFRN